MTRILSIVAVFFLLTVPILAEQPVKGEVRDFSGKLIYKTTTRGKQTEVRNPSGKLFMKYETSDRKNETRSPSGKLLYRSR
jgi:hypothetical protein